MANKSAILSVKIVSDAKEFQKGTKQAESGIDKFQKKMDKLTLPAAGILTGLAVVTKGVVGLASDAEQMQGGMQAVFGKASKEVDKFASTSAERLGMNGAAYDKLAAQIGTSLKGAGTSTKDLASETDKLISMGADLSSVFGGTGPEAVDAMSSAFRGQFDPLEKYGIIITAAMVSERLKAKGMDKLTGAALAQAKQQEINNMITEQSSQYNGNFAKEADTLAGMQERLTAKVQDLGIKLGTVLLPALTDAAQALSPVVDWVSQNIDVVFKLTGVIAGLAAGILLVSGAIRVYRAVLVVATAAQAAFGAAKGVVTGLQNFQSGFSNASAAASSFSGKMGTVGGAVKASLVWIGQSTKALVLNTGALIKNGVVAVATGIKTAALATAKGIATAAQWAYNLAMAANPMVWVIALIVGLIAVIVLVATKTTFFQDVWAKVSAFIMSAIVAVTAWFSSMWQSAIATVLSIVATISGFFGSVFAAVQAFVAVAIAAVLAKVSEIKARVQSVIDGAKALFSSGFETMRSAADSAISGVIGFIDNISGAVQGAITWVKDLFTIKTPGWLSSVFGGGGTGMEFVGNIAHTGAQFGTGATGGISVGSFSGRGSKTVINNTNVTVEFKGLVTDKVGTAREIKKLLQNEAALVGGRA